VVLLQDDVLGVAEWLFAANRVGGLVRAQPGRTLVGAVPRARDRRVQRRDAEEAVAVLEELGEVVDRLVLELGHSAPVDDQASIELPGQQERSREARQVRPDVALRERAGHDVAARHVSPPAGTTARLLTPWPPGAA
jgi:hypothetical protein